MHWLPPLLHMHLMPTCLIFFTHILDRAACLLPLQIHREVHDGPPALNLGNLRKQNVQLIGAVTSIDVCGSAPHDYCASSGTRVHVFDGVTSVKKRQISRFKDRAYGASFRQDGKLIVAGGEDSVVQVRVPLRLGGKRPTRLAELLRCSGCRCCCAVCRPPSLQVFDAGSRTLLRQFKGHTAPVHVAKFAAGQLHVLSGSDDSHVSLWDVTSGQQVGAGTCIASIAMNHPTCSRCVALSVKMTSPLALQVCTLRGHTDYVRAASNNPASADVWATCGCGR